MVYVKYWVTEKSKLSVGSQEIIAARGEFKDLGLLEAAPYMFLNSSVPNEPDKMESGFFKIHIPMARNIRGIVLAFKDAQSCSFITEVTM